MTVLNIKDFSCGYNGITVCKIPELSLQAGEACLLRGKSGSGKTTLLQTIAGLGDLQSGSLTILDTDITKLSESARDKFRGQHIGIIFQSLHLIKFLTVRQNLELIEFASGIKSEPQNIVTVLDQLGLRDFVDQPASAISQGQAQRVAFARAILAKPALLLADEPTSNLDDDAAEVLISLLLNTVKTHKMALIVASHDNRISKYFSRTLSIGATP